MDTTPADPNPSVANPTKGLIDMEDEDSGPISGEREMLEQANVPSSGKMLMSQVDEPNPKHKQKLTKIIEKHEEMGQQLKSLKTEIDGENDADDEGWQNIEAFF